MSKIGTIRKAALRIGFATLPLILCLLAAILLVGQFKESASKQEILPLTSFVVLISLSGLSFNWCRVPSAFASETALRPVYTTAVDLLIASLLALASTGLAFLQTLALPLPYFVALAVLILHWAFFVLALLLFLASVLSLIATARALERNAAKK